MEATRVTDDGPADEGILRDVGLGIATTLALLSASCCIIPLALTIVGLGGAWLSVLGPFVAYRQLVLIGVTAIVLFMWWRLFRSGIRKRGAIMASMATFAAILGWTAPFWEWELSGVLKNYWSGRQ